MNHTSTPGIARAFFAAHCPFCDSPNIDTNVDHILCSDCRREWAWPTALTATNYLNREDTELRGSQAGAITRCTKCNDGPMVLRHCRGQLCAVCGNCGHHRRATLLHPAESNEPHP